MQRCDGQKGSETFVGERTEKFGKVHDAFNCNLQREEGRWRESRKKGLAARNFQSVFLSQAKQELGGEAWKRSWEQYAEKTQGLPLSAGEDPTLLQRECLAVDCFLACMPSLPGCVAKGEGARAHEGYVGPWQTRGLQTANKDRWLFIP